MLPTDSPVRMRKAATTSARLAPDAIRTTTTRGPNDKLLLVRNSEATSEPAHVATALITPLASVGQGPRRACGNEVTSPITDASRGFIRIAAAPVTIAFRLRRPRSIRTCGTVIRQLTTIRN